MRPNVSGTDCAVSSDQEVLGTLVVDSVLGSFPISALLPKVSGANICWAIAIHTFLFFS